MTCGNGLTQVDFAIDDPAHIANPYPFLRRLRHQEPVFRSDALRAWVITRYPDVKAALSSPDLFSSSGALNATTLAPAVRQMLGVHADLAHFPGNMDAPEHNSIRRTIARSFSARAMSRLADEMHVSAWQTVTSKIARGGGDVVQDFAEVLPVDITSAFVGLPAADGAMVKSWVTNWFELFRTPHSGPEQLVLAESFLSYLNYVGALIDDRVAQPREDFVSELVSGSDGENGLSRDQVLQLVASILLGGNDTVGGLLSSVVLRLLQVRSRWTAVVDDPARIADSIEEVLRYDGPSLGDYRYATMDVEVAGVVIPAGQRVMTSRDSANHDEMVFPEPELFNPDRTNLRRHLAFGHGPHHCVGAALARLEARVALEVLTKRVPSLRLVDPHTSVRYRRAVLSRSVVSLPVEWDERY